MPALRRLESGYGSYHLVPVLQLSASDVGYRRNNFSGYAEAPGDVVSRDVVRDKPEKRRQRNGVAAGAWAGQLRDGLDVAA